MAISPRLRLAALLAGALPAGASLGAVHAGAEQAATPPPEQAAKPLSVRVHRTFHTGAEQAAAPPPEQAAKPLSVRVHRTFPHETTAFTQGLLWWRGKLYESTGRRGESEVRRIDPNTGAVELRAAIPVFFFGEGLARVGERLAMLTWQAGRLFFFATDDFARQGSKHYRGEGWGLCHDGARFVMSDGSARLHFRDTHSFAALGAVAVHMDGAPVTLLNELECVDGAVYANVFQSDQIVRIDLPSGRVTHRVDAAGLLAPEAVRQADVLNGIAHNPQSGRFYLTGKLWPLFFEVTFEDPADSQPTPPSP